MFSSSTTNIKGNEIVNEVMKGEIHVEKKFDLIVIGAGGGGYPAAFRLAKSGRRVLMVDEKGNLGGNCLYEGCVPSKSVREASVIWHDMGRAEFFGLTGQRGEADWGKIREYKDGVQTRRYAQHRKEIDEAQNLTFIRGRAHFLDAHRVQVDNLDTHDSFTAEGRDILIATGSMAESLPIPGFALTWDHHDLFAWQHTQAAMPKEMVILGAGYIGIESASMLQDLGVKVTVVEMAPQILGGMDRDLAQNIAQSLGRRVKIVTGVQVTEIVSQGPEQFLVRGTDLTHGTAVEFSGGRVMAAVGRQPNIPEALGLDKAGVAYSRHGIVADPRMRTNVRHIYAAGDVNGQSMLFHSAVRMSEIVAQDLLRGPDMDDFFNPWEMPTTVFSRPEGLAVGMTREQAQAQGIAVEEIVKSMGSEAWAQIAGELDGFFKLVVAKRSGRIVGIHGVGIDAAALSAAAHMAVRLRLTPEQLGRMTFPHPTQFEIIDRLSRSV